MQRNAVFLYNYKTVSLDSLPQLPLVMKYVVLEDRSYIRTRKAERSYKHQEKPTPLLRDVFLCFRLLFAFLLCSVLGTVSIFCGKMTIPANHSYPILPYIEMPHVKYECFCSLPGMPQYTNTWYRVI